MLRVALVLLFVRGLTLPSLVHWHRLLLRSLTHEELVGLLNLLIVVLLVGKQRLEVDHVLVEEHASDLTRVLRHDCLDGLVDGVTHELSLVVICLKLFHVDLGQEDLGLLHHLSIHHVLLHGYLRHWVLLLRVPSPSHSAPALAGTSASTALLASAS
jgi:hypothetical protein